MMLSKIVLILQMILAISTDASSWNRMESRLIHSVIETDFKFRPDLISSKIPCSGFMNLNLRGGASPFEDADGPAVNDYNLEGNEAVVEEHGNDPSVIHEGNPHHQRNAAQVEQMKEQSRSSLGFGLCLTSCDL
jgi:hypothetical protein